MKIPEKENSVKRERFGIQTYVNKSLHTKLKTEAKKQHRHLSRLVALVLSDYLDGNRALNIDQPKAVQK